MVLNLESFMIINGGIVSAIVLSMSLINNLLFSNSSLQILGRRPLVKCTILKNSVMKIDMFLERGKLELIKSGWQVLF